jgi:hypothetical protein
MAKMLSDDFLVVLLLVVTGTLAVCCAGLVDWIVCVAVPALPTL